MSKVIAKAGVTPTNNKLITDMSSIEVEEYIKSLQQYLVSLLQGIVNELK
jgi:hypothetical protein